MAKKLLTSAQNYEYYKVLNVQYGYLIDKNCSIFYGEKRS